MLPTASYTHGDCNYIRTKAAQVPSEGTVPFEALLGLGPLVDELWMHIDGCDQCIAEPATLHALVRMADGAANLCQQACTTYGLVDSLKPAGGGVAAPDQIFPPAATTTTTTTTLVCVAGSPIRLGRYHLDDQEAAVFAHQVVRRLLTDLNAFLRRLRGKGGALASASGDQWPGRDVPVDRAISRVLTLLGRLCSD